jgi:hypothetical protein
LSEYQYYNDFRLGDKTLSSFNGTIINTDENKKKMNLLPDIENITDKDSSKHGERYIRSRYQPRVIDISVIFNQDTDLDELRAWLGYDGLQKFSWEDELITEKEIDVIYNKSLDMEVYYDKDFWGECELSFIAYYPFWKVKGEKEKIVSNPIINTEYYFKGKGNIVSLPIIKLTPNGTQSTIVFKWNDLTITLQNVDKEIYIDSEDDGQVYEIINGIKVNKILKYYSNSDYDMPINKPFIKNKFILLSGSISELSVKLNSEIL